MLKRGGNKVEKGTYWNFSSGEMVEMANAGILPGNSNDKYIRASNIAVLLLGPFVGLAYILVMPFLAVIMVMTLLIGGLGTVLANLFGKTVSFGWRPVEAYLSGRKRLEKPRTPEQKVK